jgi:tetrathionate reductase subunit C
MNTTVEILGFAREPGWLPWAVQYVFLIGISAMAFFLSVPGLVWKRTAWSSVSRQALLAALVCGLAAPVALLADLHQPGRFLNFYLHTNFGSWMGWGSYLLPLYVASLLAYAWAVLLPHARGVARVPLATVAAVGAALVLLYTGMETMIIQARPLWHSLMIPLFFAVTALAGALGMTGLFGAISGRTDDAALLNRGLRLSQWALLLVVAGWLALALGGAAGYREALVTIQGGWAVAWMWFVVAAVLTLWFARGPSLLLPALFAVHGAWLARWLVYMGGQSVPKLGSTFHRQSLSLTPDSLLGILGTAGLCLVIYIVLTALVHWDAPAKA